jgi:hypothetical protein
MRSCRRGTCHPRSPTLELSERKSKHWDLSRTGCHPSSVARISGVPGTRTRCQKMALRRLASNGLSLQAPCRGTSGKTRFGLSQFDENHPGPRLLLAVGAHDAGELSGAVSGGYDPDLVKHLQTQHLSEIGLTGPMDIHAEETTPCQPRIAVHICVSISNLN